MKEEKFMSRNKLTLNEFTESLGGMIEFNQKLSATNQNEYKKILHILTKAMEGELTARQKECLILKYYKNHNVTQIALKLGVGKSTVSRHIKKAKMRLYKVLNYYLNA